MVSHGLVEIPNSVGIVQYLSLALFFLVTISHLISGIYVK